MKDYLKAAQYLDGPDNIQHIPPATNPQTLSPIFHSVTSSAIATTIPETSNPGIGDASGGGGYAPLR